ncbi:MAG: pyridoxal phosphate-dependent decarboxylase family protein, partial [Alphaproteobacteria bacterium]
MADDSLDPEDWDAFRASAHKMLDAALNKMQTATEGRVWTSFPDDLKQSLTTSLPREGIGFAQAQQAVQTLLPYGVGNTHPRFFGWVHGAGTPGGMIADIAAAAMNANLGGRDHGAMYVEKQVVEWVRQMFDFPENSSGLVVSGTSMATIIALKTARDARLDFQSRTQGIEGHRLVGYTSVQAHSCVARAFDMLGLGSDALRLIPVNAAFEMDIAALETAIADDRAAGFDPFCVVGTAGSVNVGSIDDLDAIADIAKAQNLWFHIDGAFGATGVLSDTIRPRLAGITRADSIAFDFHKWLHVNYDAGFILIRNEALHRQAFSARPDYLMGAETGLAAGNPWPTEYG